MKFEPQQKFNFSNFDDVTYARSTHIHDLIGDSHNKHISLWLPHINIDLCMKTIKWSSLAPKMFCVATENGIEGKNLIILCCYCCCRV